MRKQVVKCERVHFSSLVFRGIYISIHEYSQISLNYRINVIGKSRYLWNNELPCTSIIFAHLSCYLLPQNIIAYILCAH